MQTKRSAFQAVAGVAIACVLGIASPAHASFIAYICDDVLCTGGGDTIVTDQGAGDNFPGSAMTGQINEGAVSVAGFTIVTNVAQGKPLIGSASSPQLDLAFAATTNDSAVHTVYLYVSDTGFTGSGNFLFTLGGTQPPTGAGNSVLGKVWGGSTNNNLDFSTLLASQTSATSPFAQSATGPLSHSANPFSLTLGVAITRNSPGTTTGDANVSVQASASAVPEPATELLVALGLVGLLAARRRRDATTPVTR